MKEVILKENLLKLFETMENEISECEDRDYKAAYKQALLNVKNSLADITDVMLIYQFHKKVGDKQ